MLFCFGLIIIFDLCHAQSDVVFPLTPEGIDPLIRGLIQVPPGRKFSINDIYIRFYNGHNKPAMYHLNNISKLINNTNFDIKSQTVLYSHGYIELATDDTVLTMVNAYKEIKWNVLVLDWANLAYGNYLNAINNVVKVAKEVGKALHSMVKSGISLEGLHLIGFSLGSHVLAGAARYMAARDMKIYRLTGLDPALPGFYPPYRLVNLHITPADAQFVDIVHTDTSFYGTPVQSRHVDFWVNGGMAKQPGCPPASVFLTDQYLCSHRRSCYYWAEAVLGGGFLARSCLDYDTFLRGRCSNTTNVIGPGVDTALRGNFYLLTAAKSPFALNERGIR